MTCPSCIKAETDPDTPFQHAGCKDCAARALAQGPIFHRGGLDSSNAKPYRFALATIWGDDWREGDKLVLAAADRIKAARATKVAA